MSRVQNKISQELTIIEAGHWVNKGSLNSS